MEFVRENMIGNWIHLIPCLTIKTTARLAAGKLFRSSAQPGKELAKELSIMRHPVKSAGKTNPAHRYLPLNPAFSGRSSQRLKFYYSQALS